MSDLDGGAAAPADPTPASNEPVIAETPQPVSTEGSAAQVQADETARQAAEAKAAEEVEAKKKPEPEPAEKAKPLSARDALKKAAEKIEAADKEPTKPEKAAPIKDAPQPRADDGKFASKDGEAKAANTPAPKTEAKAAPEPKATSEADKPTPPSFTGEDEPPSRASPDAKKDWANTPPSVRGEFNRAVKELTAGLEKYRPAAERDSEIAEFHELAKKGGTTVKEALSKYVGMENQLRADPIKGLEIICQNAGLSLRDVAAHVLNQTPEQNASKQDATIRELQATIQRLEKQVGNIDQTIQTQRTQTTHEAVTKFAADHPRFEELSDDIAFFLKTRTKDLAEAYGLAERLNPAPAKAQAEVPAKASSAAVAEVVKTAPDLSVQTERGSKSIAGSPTPGSDPVSRQPSKSIKESLRRAMAAAG